VIADLVDVSEGRKIDTDVCIVGGGAAGITLALQLIGRGIDVLVLESGGYKPDERTQDLYAGDVSDELLHSPPDRYRQRRFGGTTTIWGGRCTPYDAIDFESRDYVPNSGWPFGLDELMPYYPEANRLCEAGRFAYRADEAFPQPLPPVIEGFTSEDFTADTLERFSCPTDFGRRYGAKLAAAANVRVILHANVTAIRLEPDGGSVSDLSVSDLQGNTVSVRARRYVLAAGGLEIPRLLLANRDVQPRGIGNDHDVVGRYYMCHIAGTIGQIRIDGPLTNVHYGYDISDEGVYCRRRLALRPETQRGQRLGNFVARLHHPRISDPAHRNAVLSLLYLAKFVIPYEYGKRLHGGDRVSIGDWLCHVGNVVRSPFDAAGFAWHMLRDRKFAERKFPSVIVRPRRNLYSLDFHAEQQPNPSSRVQLSDRADALGMPRLKVDWGYTAGDVDTCSRALELLSRSMSRSGIARFDYDADSVELEMTRFGAYGGHHIGTTRMGVDPRFSVVNADCRVHGIRNLYISGSATFPTSSQANPTLTVVAMSLRLAEHLRKAHTADE
jgi:choline dehydrogenase-like flavoprotein